MADEEQNHATEHALIILDGDPAERTRIESMAEELGVEIWAATPEDLVPERGDTWESLTQARAVVVSTRFGPRSGLELIEYLHWHPDASPRVLALSLDEPGRAWIEAAMRAGATTCLLRPLELEELRKKVVDPSAPDSAPESDAADGGEENGGAEADGGDEAATS